MKVQRPRACKNPDFSQVVAQCSSYMDEVMEAFKDGSGEPYKEEDFKEWIFEEALMAIYGRDIFDNVINKLGEEDES